MNQLVPDKIKMSGLLYQLGEACVHHFCFEVTQYFLYIRIFLKIAFYKIMFKNFVVMEVTNQVIYVENMEFVFCYDRLLKNEYNVNNFYLELNI